MGYYLKLCVHPQAVVAEFFSFLLFQSMATSFPCITKLSLWVWTGEMLQYWQVSPSHAFLQPLDQRGMQVLLKHHIKSSEHFQDNKNHAGRVDKLHGMVGVRPWRPLVTSFFIHPFQANRREQ